VIRPPRRAPPGPREEPPPAPLPGACFRPCCGRRFDGRRGVCRGRGTVHRGRRRPVMKREDLVRRPGESAAGRLARLRRLKGNLNGALDHDGIDALTAALLEASVEARAEKAPALEAAKRAVADLAVADLDRFARWFQRWRRGEPAEAVQV